MGDGKNPRGKVGPRSRNSYHLSHIILLAIWTDINIYLTSMCLEQNYLGKYCIYVCV